MLANLLISQRFEGTGLVAAFNGLALHGKRCRGSNLVDAPLLKVPGDGTPDGTMRQRQQQSVYGLWPGESKR